MSGPFVLTVNQKYYTAAPLIVVPVRIMLEAAHCGGFATCSRALGGQATGVRVLHGVVTCEVFIAQTPNNTTTLSIVLFFFVAVDVMPSVYRSAWGFGFHWCAGSWRILSSKGGGVSVPLGELSSLIQSACGRRMTMVCSFHAPYIDAQMVLERSVVE